ncbi:MAG: hypothetical protein ACLFTQ_00135 [Candidatus Aenigmatarchaeota archaeon]
MSEEEEIELKVGMREGLELRMFETDKSCPACGEDLEAVGVGNQERRKGHSAGLAPLQGIGREVVQDSFWSSFSRCTECGYQSPVYTQTREWFPSLKVLNSGSRESDAAKYYVKAHDCSELVIEDKGGEEIASMPVGRIKSVEAYLDDVISTFENLYEPSSDSREDFDEALDKLRSYKEGEEFRAEIRGQVPGGIATVDEIQGDLNYIF